MKDTAWPVDMWGERDDAQRLQSHFGGVFSSLVKVFSVVPEGCGYCETCDYHNAGPGRATSFAITSV